MTKRLALALPLLCGSLLSVPAHAERGNGKKPSDRGMSMPDLGAVLGTAWQVPPELSDRAMPGAILEVGEAGYRTVLSGCVEGSPVENSVTNVTMQNSLSGGVRWGTAGAGARASAEAAMKVSFIAPFVSGYELISFVPSQSCVADIQRYAARGTVSNLVLVQETLFARISGCESQSASIGGGAGGVGLSASGTQACQMFSDTAVAVGVKTVSLGDIPEFAELVAAEAPPPPPPPEPGMVGKVVDAANPLTRKDKPADEGTAAKDAKPADAVAKAPPAKEPKPKKQPKPKKEPKAKPEKQADSATPAAPVSSGFPKDSRWAFSPIFKCQDGPECASTLNLTPLRTGWFVFDVTDAPMVAYTHLALYHKATAPYRSYGHLSLYHKADMDSQGLIISVGATKGDFDGVLVGVGFNKAERVRGFQLGLVNIADDLTGVQLGLVNIDKNGRKIPILNWRFKD